MDCFEVCPEPQVIRPALKGEAKGVGPVILSADCTNCGRCIDVCSKDVFTFGMRFNNSASAVPLSCGAVRIEVMIEFLRRSAHHETST
jgi:ferredoxin-type protein NapH